jgi:gluconate 2-dehydrogenase alpha chain
VTETLPKKDVAIVGLGAAGGVAALPLAEAGLEVVGLEAGPWRTHGDFWMDEIRHDIRNWLGNTKFNRELPTWRRTPTSPTEVPAKIPLVNGVGGTSVAYTAQIFRFPPWTFGIRSNVIERYGASALPPDTTITDWPITYEELESYYDRAEYAVGVSGQAGNVNGEIDPRGNPFEGPRSRPYPMPPLRRTDFLDLMSDAAAGLGWHPFPCPAAINSEPYDGRPACTYCGFTSLNGCHVDAKGATSVTTIPRAMGTGRFTVVPNARATRIEVDGDGRASGVTYLRGGREWFQPAGAVLLSTYTYENVRLLLLSASDAYPDGLSNNARQVGRHYMTHAFPFAYGLFPERKLNLFSGPWSQGTGVDDWNVDNFDHDGLGFVGGSVLVTTLGVKPVYAARTTPPGVPTWGSEWKGWLRRNANSVASVGAHNLEVLPYEDHVLDLDPEVRDPQGFPVLRVTFDLKDNERRQAEFLNRRSEEWLRAAGATETWTIPAWPMGINSHAFGGTRMGDDPDTSVVDRWCFSHEVPNLGILSGSTFVSAAGHNPTNTIQALSWRAADHLVAEWSSIAGT